MEFLCTIILSSMQIIVFSPPKYDIKVAQSPSSSPWLRHRRLPPSLPIPPAISSARRHIASLRVSKIRPPSPRAARLSVFVSRAQRLPPFSNFTCPSFHQLSSNQIFMDAKSSIKVEIFGLPPPFIPSLIPALFIPRPGPQALQCFVHHQLSNPWPQHAST